MFCAEGVWLRTTKPLRVGDLFFDWSVLPVSHDEAERITRRLAATEAPRYFVVTDDAEKKPERRSVAVAVVRLTGTTSEAFTRDLAWVPYDLPGIMAGQRRWTVRAVTENDAKDEQFQVHKRVRYTKQTGEWAGEYDYFAIFADVAAGLDVGNARMVVRRRGEVEETFVRSAGWVPTDELSRLEAKGPFAGHLPISPEEAAQLTGN